jgi:hypothetical protein
MKSLLAAFALLAVLAFVLSINRSQTIMGENVPRPTTTPAPNHDRYVIIPAHGSSYLMPTGGGGGSGGYTVNRPTQ